MRARKTRKKGPVKTFKSGRVCKHVGCKQRLSVYNSEDLCHVHYKESLR